MAKNSTALKLVSGLFGSKPEKTEREITPCTISLEGLVIPTLSSKIPKSQKVSAQELEGDEKPLTQRKTARGRQLVRQDIMTRDDDDVTAPVEAQEEVTPEADKVDIPVCADNGKGKALAGLGDMLAKMQAAEPPEAVVEEPEVKLPETQTDAPAVEPVKAVDAELDAAVEELRACLLKPDAPTEAKAEAEAAAEEGAPEQEPVGPNVTGDETPADETPDEEPAEEAETEEAPAQQDAPEEAEPKEEPAPAAQDEVPNEEMPAPEANTAGVTGNLSGVAKAMAAARAKAAAGAGSKPVAEEDGWFDQKGANQLLTALKAMKPAEDTENVEAPFVRKWPKRDPSFVVAKAAPLKIKF